ncbi:hypothetical protein RHMOL_Rhmol09G0146900 [Rhododendron molle]|nr:hypothetical protein RHMOL_Rhmol09G0146900 [Rhododendron molle]
MIQLLATHWDETHQLSALLNDCSYLLQQLGVTQIEHSFKEGNACADRLANMGLQMEIGIHVLVNMPSCISIQLRADAQRVSYLRLMYSTSY